MTDKIPLANPNAHVFVPDGISEATALGRITHLGIGAHPDDLEFMAFHGIIQCFASQEKWFGGVTCSNGSGSARAGVYAACTDEQLVKVRLAEQNKAAVVGEYGIMLQLGYGSKEVKTPADRSLEDDLFAILEASTPEVIYTHNLADKHETHIGVVIATLRALRRLPKDKRPKQVIGCEVWRDLDWLDDSAKIFMDITGHDHTAGALNGIFDSQIAGGKRYDISTPGRRAANATYFNSHTTDAATQAIIGMDLTPLIVDDSLDICKYALAFVQQLHNDIETKLNAQLSYPR